MVDSRKMSSLSGVRGSVLKLLRDRQILLQKLQKRETPSRERALYGIKNKLRELDPNGGIARSLSWFGRPKKKKTYRAYRTRRSRR